MKILILGGNGFIGSAALRALALAGHEVTAIGRDVALARQRMRFSRWIQADIAHLTSDMAWAPYLEGIDAVVNCAGALQYGARDDLDAVQHRAMLALYAAARRQPDIRIVQISARTTGPAAGTPFLATKRAADDVLISSGLCHTILRPALVIGPNAHGGSALVRALAALPLITPLTSSKSAVQTVSLDDVTTVIVSAVEGGLGEATDIELASAGIDTLESLVAKHRLWLGLPTVRTVTIPFVIARTAGLAADFAGWLGWRSPLRSTALKVMTHGITAERNEAPALPFVLKSLDETLRAHPASVEHVWFARLYLLKPLVFATLSLFWILSGAISLSAVEAGNHHLAAAGFSPTLASIFTFGTSFTDILLGALVLIRSCSRMALLGMLILSFLYLAFATALIPALWLDPLGPLVKVVPAIVLTLVGLAILDER